MTNHQSPMDIGKGFLTMLFDFSLKEMITPKIMRFLFILGVVGSGILALIYLIVAFTSGSAGFIILMLLLSPLVFLGAVILIRVYLELIMVMFNIYHELRNK